MINGVYINGEPINGDRGESPLFIAECSTIDALHLRLVFSRPVVRVEASNPAHYAITGSPLGLIVKEAIYETDFVYVLTTDDQVEGQTYLLTATNIHDLDGNPI